MEHWEFLLQKEGDCSWLPLDSPDVEILEGRYRIVARSSNSNAAIETRITHVATEAVPPKRRVQKRSCHTNQDGLMVVIPFTRLEPGLWELQCSPEDLLTDLMAGAQAHAVTLQVVARDLEEDWEPDWTVSADASMATTMPSFDHAKMIDGSGATNVTEAGPRESILTEPALSSDVAPLPAAEELLHTTNDRQIPLPPEVAEILGASMDRLFQIAEQLSGQLVDEVLQDFDLTTSADAPPPIEATSAIEAKSDDRAVTNASTVSVASDSDSRVLPHQLESVSTSNDTLAVGETFLLTLDQTAFVAARGEVITLSGRVAIVPQVVPPSIGIAQPALLAEPTESVASTDADPWDEAALNLSGATAQALQLCLRDPQSLQILVSDRQPLPSAAPFSFTFSFSLPDTFSTHLALGEVLLCGSLPGKLKASIALTTQAFSITVDPTALMGELAKLHEALTTDIDDERLDLPLELSSRLKEQASLPLDLSFLNLATVEPAGEQAPRFPSLAGQPLPPQLYRPNPEASAKPLDLPAFKLTNASEPPTAVQDESVIPENIVVDAIGTPTAAADTNAVNASEAVQIPPGNLAETPSPEAIDSATPVSAPAIAAVAPEQANADKTLDLPSPSHMEFHSLKLQDRFLTRLTSLATDTELSALLKANLALGDTPFSATTTPSAADTRSLTEEIVVDDEPQSSERRRNSPTIPEPSSDEPPNPLVLPADEAVPTPTLEVTTGELVSGKPVNVRVKLPNLLPKIYVKLWITDRQTRSLLDGPRWLVDFLPNGLGDLEAMPALTVPFGSVEIRLEAIAVEMHTQRESHKVTVDRVVVPPNLPNVSLDDFHDQ